MDIPVIISNIIGFDGIIFIAAAVEFKVGLSVKSAAKKLHSSMYKEVYAPSYDSDMKNIKVDMDNLTDMKVANLRKDALQKYTLFTNIIGIFPLLGILGTVYSLLGMVGNEANVNGSFFAALTSTFWGIVFAILSKLADSAISPDLDDGDRAAELLLQRRAEARTSALANDDVLEIFRGSENESPENEEKHETKK